MNMQYVFMFDQVFLGEQWQQGICIPFKFKMEFEFAKPLQYTSFNWNHPHINATYIKFQPSTRVIVHCIYFAPLIVVCRIEVEPEQEATPFVEDPDTEPRQQGKQPPFDHIFTLAPLLISLCCLLHYTQPSLDSV